MTTVKITTAATTIKTITRSENADCVCSLLASHCPAQPVLADGVVASYPSKTLQSPTEFPSIWVEIPIRMEIATNAPIIPIMFVSKVITETQIHNLIKRIDDLPDLKN